MKKVTEKSDRKKATENSRVKVTKKAQAQYDAIVAYMQPNVWYKASELVSVLGVKETRTKELLRALVAKGLLVDNGATKGKSYKKI